MRTRSVKLLPNDRVDSWYGRHSPLVRLKDRCRDAFEGAGDSPGSPSSLQSEGLEIVARTTQMFGEYVSSEEKRWGHV